MRPRRTLLYLYGGAASRFGIAGFARFIRPGGWAVWPAVGLLTVATLCLVGVARELRRLGG